MAQHRSHTRRQVTVTKQTHTPPAGSPPKGDDEAPRRVRLGDYKSFRLQKKKLAPAYEDRGLVGGMKLLKRSLKQLWRHKWLFGGITLIFGLVNLALAGGFMNSQTFNNIVNGFSSNPLDPSSLTASPDGTGTQASIGATFLTLLISAGGGNGISQSTAAFQFLLISLATMALIWSLRQIQAGHKATIRGAWYFGTAAWVPYILVLAVILLEFVPFGLGGYMEYTLIGNGITQGFLENALVILAFVLLTTLTLYWVSASVFALQIVTLRGTTPIQALRSANELVRYRRGVVLRRLVVLAVVYLLIAVFIIVPVAFSYTPAAVPTFFVLLMISITVTQTYLYNLYRELIG